MTRASATTAGLLLCVAAMTSACSNAANDGDRSAKLRFDDTIYEFRSEPRGLVDGAEPVGPAEVVGYGSVQSAIAVDEVAAFPVNGYGTSVALLVPSGDYPGVYVAAGTPRSEMPPRDRPRERDRPG